MIFHGAEQNGKSTCACFTLYACHCLCSTRDRWNRLSAKAGEFLKSLIGVECNSIEGFLFTLYIACFCKKIKYHHALNHNVTRTTIRNNVGVDYELAVSIFSSMCIKDIADMKIIQV